MADSKDCDALFKIVLIGDSAVGKTSLLLRFADDTFGESYIATIGVDFRFRNVEVDGKQIKLQIWDTAGQERFRTITNAYYRGADGIILVYDVTSSESFKAISGWLSEVNRFADPGTSRMMIGNKADMVNEKQVDAKEAQEHAQKLGISFIETSAKTGTNVEDSFMTLARELLANKPKKDAMKANNVKKVDIKAGLKKNDLSNCCK